MEKKQLSLVHQEILKLKIDYTLPFLEVKRIEAGYEAEFENSDENNGLYLYDSLSTQYINQPQFSNSVNYINNYQAFYATYTDQFGDFGIQGGLRTEYTYRTITLLDQLRSTKLNAGIIFQHCILLINFLKAHN